MERGRFRLSKSATKLAKLHNGVGDIVKNATFFAHIGLFGPVARSAWLASEK